MVELVIGCLLALTGCAAQPEAPVSYGPREYVVASCPRDLDGLGLGEQPPAWPLLAADPVSEFVYCLALDDPMLSMSIHFEERRIPPTNQLRDMLQEPDGGPRLKPFENCNMAAKPYANLLLAVIGPDQAFRVRLPRTTACRDVMPGVLDTLEAADHTVTATFRVDRPGS